MHFLVTRIGAAWGLFVRNLTTSLALQLVICLC